MLSWFYRSGSQTCGGDGDNLASNFSQKLFGAGKEDAVVIGHETKSGPEINGEGKTKAKDQDYRFGTRVVYHNGTELFRDKSKKVGLLEVKLIEL